MVKMAVSSGSKSLFIIVCNLPRPKVDTTIPYTNRMPLLRRFQITAPTVYGTVIPPNIYQITKKLMKIQTLIIFGNFREFSRHTHRCTESIFVICESPSSIISSDANSSLYSTRVVCYYLIVVVSHYLLLLFCCGFIIGARQHAW